jgi:hypothetical protein
MWGSWLPVHPAEEDDCKLLSLFLGSEVKSHQNGAILGLLSVTHCFKRFLNVSQGIF